MLICPEMAWYTVATVPGMQRPYVTSLTVLAGTVVLPAAPAAAFPGRPAGIAFQRHDHGLADIHTIKPDGTGDTQITFGWATDGAPDWRPA